MKKKDTIVGSVVIILIITVFFAINYFNSNPKKYTEKDIFIEDDVLDKDNNHVKEGKNKFMVEIKGEVKKPEVYIMSQGSIVKDIILEAGGITEKGDLSKINQAKKLRDGDCITVPSKEITTEVNKTFPQNNSLSKSGDEIININTASKEELMKLPGVGEVTAQKIIDYREKNGEFSSIEDLKKVDRIGDKTLEKFKDKIDVR